MDKSPDAFRTISEVAELLETPAHVLRFWESRFPQIKPVKRAGGRRYYRPADMALLAGIRKLLHDEGITIRGVQKILREQGVRHVSGLTEESEVDEVDLPRSEVAQEQKPSSDPIPLFPVAKEPQAANTQSTASYDHLKEHTPRALDAVSLDDPENTPPQDVPPAQPELSFDHIPPRDETESPARNSFDAEGDTPSVAEPVPTQVAGAASMTPPIEHTSEQPPVASALPAPLPQIKDTRIDNLAADLRRLSFTGFGEKKPQAKALFTRLEALRHKVSDLGRSPRR